MCIIDPRLRLIIIAFLRIDMTRELIREVQVGGSEGYLAFLDGFIDELRVELGFNEDVASNIVISLSEAMNNAYLHGNNANKDLPIGLTVYRDNDVLAFAVSDSGDGFDYGLLRDDLIDDLLDVPGGRGIFIMRALADEVCFNELGNETTLKFRIADGIASPL